jgi:hypothetical protein
MFFPFPHNIWFILGSQDACHQCNPSFNYLGIAKKLCGMWRCYSSCFVIWCKSDLICLLMTCFDALNPITETCTTTIGWN